MRYYVIKNIKRIGDFESAIVTGGGEKFMVTGNIPELYHGMSIDLELDADKTVLDYTLNLFDKNRTALKNAGIDISEYIDTLEKHSILKYDGISWKSSKLSVREAYNYLSFSEADCVHKKLVGDATDDIRLETINRRIIERARLKRKISYKVDEYLGYFDDIEEEGAYQRLMTSLKMLCVSASRYGVSDGKVWDRELKEKEDYIHEEIERRRYGTYDILTEKEIEAFLEEIKDSKATEEQKNILWSLRDNAFCVLTGGAGTGKTSVIDLIIKCYAKHYNKSNILLVAPTGKASRRLYEKTGMQSMTIHRALRKNPASDYVYCNDDNPLPHRLVVVDEASMVDTELMYDLINAVSRTSKIIFVGDHNQLYPVSYGEPFFDFLEKLEVFKLTKVHRQEEGSDILANANAVLLGRSPFSGNGVSVENIAFEDIGNIVLALSEDVQIVSPFNDLNGLINEFLKKGDDRFNIGDKVITLRNTKSYVNGDLGLVKDITKKGEIVIDISGEIVSISKAHYSDLALAYALTVHKMQGSEADKIALFLPKNSFIDKRMLYTGITRAKKELYIYYYEERE